MSDRALLAIIVVTGFTLQIAGLVLLGLRLGATLRESQRLARAVGALVLQEGGRMGPRGGR